MLDNNIAQLELPTYMGEKFEKLPDDLFIPPNALEICLETFSGPLDLLLYLCLLYTSPSPRDPSISRMPSSA